MGANRIARMPNNVHHGMTRWLSLLYIVLKSSAVLPCGRSPGRISQPPDREWGWRGSRVPTYLPTVHGLSQPRTQLGELGRTLPSGKAGIT